jgi:hypothetical protein
MSSSAATAGCGRRGLLGSAAAARPAALPTPPRPDRRPALPLRQRRRPLLPAPNSFGFDGFLTLGSLLKPEAAALVSAAVALSSVGLNYYGSIATEQRRALLQAQLEEERSLRAQQAELQSIIGRYRGPLLESSVDLENRLWHMATKTGEWSSDPSSLCFEEITYTLFCLSQCLGFVEIVRREAPRERSFLQLGSPHGGDTLSTLLEGVKFALCASPATLEAWLAEPDAVRDHPGARTRMLRRPLGGEDHRGDHHHYHRGGGGEDDDSATDSDDLYLPGLRISRGIQRAVGALMTATPMGAERHYTLSYSEFVRRLKGDEEFRAWFRPLEHDLAALLTGPCWRGESPGAHPWTRILLLQQLLVDTVDLLDPDFVRVAPSRRLRLSPVRYAPLPNVDVFRLQLSALSTGIDPLISAALRQVGETGSNDDAAMAAAAAKLAAVRGDGSGGGVGGGKSSVRVGASRSLFLNWAGSSSAQSPSAIQHQPHFQALASLQAEWDGSVTSTSSGEEEGGGGGGGGVSARFVGGSPVLPPELLPEVGVTGVSLTDLKRRRRAFQAAANGNGNGNGAVPALVGGDAGQQPWSLLTPLGGLLGGIKGGGGGSKAIIGRDE